MNNSHLYQKSLEEKSKSLFLAHNKIFQMLNEIEMSISLIINTIKKGNTIFFCGNGGSCADAMHLSAELTVRLRPKINRKPISAVCLSSDSVNLTACGNDYGFDNIFLRNLQAHYKKGDILIVLSTSGNSSNIIEILKFCKRKNIKTLGFLGNKGGKAKKYCNYKLIVKSNNTATIQELHIFLGHFILEMVENNLIKKNEKFFKK